MNPIEIKDLPKHLGKRVCVSHGDTFNPIAENWNGTLMYATLERVGIRTGEEVRMYPLNEAGKVTTVYPFD